MMSYVIALGLCVVFVVRAQPAAQQGLSRPATPAPRPVTNAIGPKPTTSNGRAPGTTLLATKALVNIAATRGQDSENPLATKADPPLQTSDVARGGTVDGPPNDLESTLVERPGVATREPSASKVPGLNGTRAAVAVRRYDTWIKFEGDFSSLLRNRTMYDAINASVTRGLESLFNHTLSVRVTSLLAGSLLVKAELTPVTPAAAATIPAGDASGAGPASDLIAQTLFSQSAGEHFTELAVDYMAATGSDAPPLYVASATSVEAVPVGGDEPAPPQPVPVDDATTAEPPATTQRSSIYANGMDPPVVAAIVVAVVAVVSLAIVGVIAAVYLGSKRHEDELTAAAVAREMDATGPQPATQRTVVSGTPTVDDFVFDDINEMEMSYDDDRAAELEVKGAA